MSQGPVQPVAQANTQPGQDALIYSEEDMVEHGELARLMTRKETVLHIVMERAYKEGDTYLGNTIAFIMADYKFITLPEKPGEQEQ